MMLCCCKLLLLSAPCPRGYLNFTIKVAAYMVNAYSSFLSVKLNRSGVPGPPLPIHGSGVGRSKRQYRDNNNSQYLPSVSSIPTYWYSCMQLSSRLSHRPATNMFKIPPPQPLASAARLAKSRCLSYLLQRPAINGT